MVMDSTNDLISSPPAAGPGWGNERRQNQFYRPFLRGALVTVLTIGCTLGAINLAVMGFGADLTAVWAPLIQAHGYAQMFGWVGLFIMGIAYHTVPRFFLRPLRRPRLVRPSFGLTGAALGLRFVAQPFAAQHPAAAALLVVSALLGLGGMTLFVWAMYDTLRQGSDRVGSPAGTLYLAAGFAGLWVGQAATLVLMVTLAWHGQDAIPTAADAPYLRLVLSGAIVTTILGYTLRTVPHMLGLRPPPAGVMRGILAAYIAAVLMEIAADSGLLGAISHEMGAVGAAGELLALLGFTARSGVFNPSALRTTALAVRNPWPERFVRMAYGWLLISAALNLAYSLRAWAANPVPHAFVASYHHALTVGFISLMILGMSMRLVPVFIGAMNRRPALAGVVFVLINVGNVTRVVSEGLAQVVGGGFYVAMGLSGLIEVAGLTIYAVALWRALAQPSYGQVPARDRPASSTAARPLPARHRTES
jgi:uncharacterized protein involved in response to NO